jgi:hypothetical protein
MNSFPLNHFVCTSTNSHNTGDSPSERSDNTSESPFDGSGNRNEREFALSQLSQVTVRSTGRMMQQD